MKTSSGKFLKIVALAGGVGGAKLAYGLLHSPISNELTVIVNTGDDLQFCGLYVSPDLDTMVYNLAGLSNPGKGWGRIDDTFFALNVCGQLGGPEWFKIGDKDLGMHLERTRQLILGKNLSDITRSFCKQWGIKASILPMTNDKVSTIIETNQHEMLPFQEYFVHRNCEPKISTIHFQGIEKAAIVPEALEAINDSDLIIICPSNPWVSIDPILNLKGMRSALYGKYVLAVSPIIQGKTIKGPAAKMFYEMGIMPTATAVTLHYQGLIKSFILDVKDKNEIATIEKLGIKCFAANTIMNTDSQKIFLAEKIINFANKNFS